MDDAPRVLDIARAVVVRETGVVSVARCHRRVTGAFVGEYEGDSHLYRVTRDEWRAR